MKRIQKTSHKFHPVIQVQTSNQIEKSSLDTGATQVQKIQTAEEHSLKGVKEMGLVGKSCQRLREIASDVNTNRGRKITMIDATDGDKKNRSLKF